MTDLTKEQLEKKFKRIVFKETRKKASPRVNDYDLHVMRNAEKIRKAKGINHEDILPEFDERYYRLLRGGFRKLYNMQLYLIAEGLECSVDDLVRGFGYNEKPK